MTLKKEKDSILKDLEKKLSEGSIIYNLSAFHLNP